MSFFSPKCPHCGAKLEATGYSIPGPDWRCNSCIQRNGATRKVMELEARLAELEEKDQTNE